MISVDTETNYTDRFHERFCLGISIATAEETYYIPVGHDAPLPNMDPGNLQVPANLLDTDATVVFHNAKFDLHVLNKVGVSVRPDRVYDTMLMSHLIYEERFSHDLDMLALDYLGKRKEGDLSKKMKSFGWTETPPVVMAKYAVQDAVLTRELYLHLKPHFEQFDDMWRKYERPFMYLLLNMEAKGIAIDLAKTKELEKECESQLIKMQMEIGFDPAKTKTLHLKLFSPPPTGLGLRVLTTTPGGKPQVNSKFLERTVHPICEQISSYRETAKQLTSYYRSYQALAGDYGRIHASFKQHGTVTGRLSCADPNMQQIPRESEIKSLFLPDAGSQLWEIDYSTIEMRMAAVYSKEQSLLDVFRSGGDVHQLTADLCGITRQHAKIVNFLTIYGGGPDALAVQLRIYDHILTEIQRYTKKKCPCLACETHARFKAAYKNLFRFMEQAKLVTERDRGTIKMWSGRYRHFKWKGDYRKAFNAIVQGGSFEIVKRSMLVLEKYNFDIHNQVHDSVWIMFPDNDEVEVKVKEAEAIMSDWTLEAFGLPFPVESKRLA